MSAEQSERSQPSDAPAAALPISLWQSSLEGAFLSVEVASVLSLRMMSLSGFRPMASSEPLRMVVEKPPAFLASGIAAWSAAASGQRADQILAASLRPLRLEARANADRLLRGAANLGHPPNR